MLQVLWKQAMKFFGDVLGCRSIFATEVCFRDLGRDFVLRQAEVARQVLDQ